MYQAAIVEDEEIFLKNTKDLLARTFLDHNVSVAFDFFLSGKEYLPMFEQHFHYDMIFLDIEMPGIDGISLCKRIREISPDALVVFISNKESLVFQTFEVQPFRFIRKSELKELADGLVNAILSELDRRSPKTIRFVENSTGDVFSYDVRKILYIEAQRKETVIHTLQGRNAVRIRFMDMENMLSKYPFMKVHRSFLVNMDAVSQIKKDDCILINGDAIPISRGLKDQVKQTFLDYSMN